MEGLAPAGAVLHAVGVHAGAADAEQGLVLEVAPQLRNEINTYLGLQFEVLTGHDNKPQPLSATEQMLNLLTSSP